MMPDMEKLGVSRKIEDEDIRRTLRETLRSLNPPTDFGFIARTAAIGKPKAELKRDLTYLQRLWKQIKQKMQSKMRVGELYAESDLVIRTLRDVYTPDIDQVIIDNPFAARRAHEFLAIANPRAAAKIMYYKDNVPIFHRYRIEHQIENINSREVELPSGGSLVFDQTEALVAIDVNSGKNRSASDAETTAYKTNKEACDEVCRQLRLRDLGGLVVIDLIDMRPMRHRRDIESRFNNHFKNDRSRVRTAPISPFGLMELTRQRMRPSLKKSLFTECENCTGLGHVMSSESTVLKAMRKLSVVMQQTKVKKVILTISPDVAFHLLNNKRTPLVAIELKYDKKVTVRVNGGGTVDSIEFSALDEKDQVINLDKITIPAQAQLIDAKTLPPVEDIEFEEFEIDLEELTAEAQKDKPKEAPKPQDKRSRSRGGKNNKNNASNNDKRSRGNRGDNQNRNDNRNDNRNKDKQNENENEETTVTESETKNEQASSNDDRNRGRNKNNRGRNNKNNNRNKDHGRNKDQDQNKDQDRNKDQDQNSEQSSAKNNQNSSNDNNDTNSNDNSNDNSKRRKRGSRGSRGKGRGSNNPTYGNPILEGKDLPQVKQHDDNDPPQPREKSDPQGNDVNGNSIHIPPTHDAKENEKNTSNNRSRGGRPSSNNKNTRSGRGQKTQDNRSRSNKSNDNRSRGSRSNDQKPRDNQSQHNEASKSSNYSNNAPKQEQPKKEAVSTPKPASKPVVAENPKSTTKPKPTTKAAEKPTVVTAEAKPTTKKKATKKKATKKKAAKKATKKKATKKKATKKKASKKKAVTKKAATPE